MTVTQLLRSTSSAELSEWRAFYRLDRQLRDEAAIDADLDREAEAGIDQIRRRLRGDG